MLNVVTQTEWAPFVLFVGLFVGFLVQVQLNVLRRRRQAMRSLVQDELRARGA
jgi:hypothetical protein